MTEDDAKFLVGLLGDSEEEEYILCKLQDQYHDLPWDLLRYGPCERCGKTVGTHYPTVPNVCGACTTEAEHAERRSRRQTVAYADILRVTQETLMPTLADECFKSSTLMSKLRKR